MLSKNNGLWVFRCKMELEPMPKHLEISVMASVNETGNRLAENRDLLQQWIKCQPHLPHTTYGKPENK